MLTHVTGAGPGAATQDWREPVEGEKGKLKERVKSSIKAGVKVAGVSGFREAKGLMIGQHPTKTHTSLAAAESSEEEDDIVGPSEQRRYAAMLANMSMQKSGDDNGFGKRKEKDTHTRFKREILDIMDDSSELNEDLLDGLIPPASGFCVSETPGPPPKIGSKLSAQEPGSNKAEMASEGLKRRPLPLDPSLGNVQDFAWPDAEEIAEYASTGKEIRESRHANRNIAKGNPHILSLMNIPGLDMGKNEVARHMARLQQSGGAFKTATSSVDSPDRRPQPASRSTTDCARLRLAEPHEDFGIEWPSTPTDEPCDTGVDETLRKYVSPATEAFNLLRGEDEDPLSAPSASNSDDRAPKITTEGLLFARVVAKMVSCLGEYQVLTGCHARRSDTATDLM